MHNEIKTIFNHSRDVIIDAIKTFVKAQPNELYDLKECQNFYNVSEYGEVQTFKMKSLHIFDDENLCVKFKWGWGFNTADSCMQEIYIDINDLTMNEIYEIIKGM